MPLQCIPHLESSGVPLGLQLEVILRAAGAVDGCVWGSRRGRLV